MTDAFILPGKVLAEAFGVTLPIGPILVTIPQNTLSFGEYLELALLKETMPRYLSVEVLESV